MKTIKFSAKVTLIQLEYIVAVDNYRHFATAAEHCFVTQPTLSMQLQKLEEQLEVLIFDRSKQPVVPTELGGKIISQARIVLKEAKIISDIIESESGTIKGDLRIGIIPTLAPYLLPLFIAGFLDKYPEVSVKVEELVTKEIISRLNNDLLDIGILVTPLHDSSIIERPLFYEHFIGYVGQTTGLAKDKNITVSDLITENIWILNEGHCFREQVLNICDLKALGPVNSSFTYESGSIEAIRRLVDTYGGVTLLPELSTFDMEDSSGEKLRYFKEPEPSREVSLVMYRSYLKKKLVDALFDEIMASIPKSMLGRKQPNIVNWI